MSKIANPFREDSNIAKVFAMAVQGTTRSAIERFATRRDLNVQRLFHVLHVGEYGDSKWQYQQDEDGNVKLLPAVARRKGPQRAASNRAVQRTSRAA